MTVASLIGFGEAGRAFASDGWRAFDSDPARTRTASLSEALDGATIVISLVTADQALASAKAAAAAIAPGTLYFDMNSVAPATKRAASAAIEAVGGRYVDVAVMSPVEPKRRAVPLLVSGPHAGAGAAALGELGFSDVRTVGDEIGRASSIKMIRSVMVKGVEALTAEMMLGARAAGVEAEVLASLGDGWVEQADYNLERMTTHGRRRAAEMEEVVATLAALGVDPVMTRVTIIRQREMAA